MTTLRKKSAVAAVGGFFGLVALALSGNVMAAKCEVTSGPNKGKQGTYTEDGQWCEGTWGGTECKDSSGNSKCKNLALILDSSGDVPIFDGNNGTVVVTQGYFETPNNGLVRCTTSVPTAATSPASAVCFPVVAEKLGDLTTSKEATDVSIARAVSAAVGSLPVVKSP
jgi:hypothetical protein